MSPFSYFWNSDAHLHSLVFWIDLGGGTLDVLLAVVTLAMLRKELTEHKKKKVEYLIESGALIVAILVVVTVIGMSRAETLQDKHLDDKLINLNPLKQPISDISAIVKIVVKENPTLNKPLPWNTTGLGYVCKMMFSTMPNELNATRFCPLNGQLEGLVGKAPESRTYLLKFQVDPFTSALGAGFGMPVDDFDKVNALWLQELFLPDGAEIINGSVSVTINSSIRKVFPIPAQKVGAPFYLEITSVRTTNGDWVPFSR